MMQARPPEVHKELFKLSPNRGQVLSSVLGDAFWLTSIGIVLALTAAVWLTRFIRAMLYGLGRTDVLTVVSTAVVLMLVSRFAAFAPARRASRIDPFARCGTIEMQIGILVVDSFRSLLLSPFRRHAGVQGCDLSR